MLNYIETLKVANTLWDSLFVQKRSQLFFKKLFKKQNMSSEMIWSNVLSNYYVTSRYKLWSKKQKQIHKHILV